MGRAAVKGSPAIFVVLRYSCYLAKHKEVAVTPEVFEQQLRREGYIEFVMIEKPPNGGLDIHSHPPETRALIVAGDMYITIANQERHYGPGSSFHLAPAEEHTERYGPRGVTYFVGRKVTS